MAKPRRGLGRGLNSLLSSPVEETKHVEEDNKSRIAQPERYTVPAEERASYANVPAKNAKETPSAPKQSDVAANAAGMQTSTAEVKQDQDNIYSDKVDNITIKSVVEREVPKPVYTQPKVEKEPLKKREVAAEEVDIETIEPNPDQPRTNFKRDELEELAESIKRDGLLQPILVRKLDDGHYQIIAGERRWQACKSLGMKTVPIRVKEVDDNRAIELALVENLQRSDLNPIEEAYGYRRMMERSGLTQSEVAKILSKGRSTIANALRLLELPEDAQQLIFEEKITAGHARAILSIPTEEGRKSLTQKLMSEHLSVRETEAIARLLSGKKSESKTPRVPTPQSYKKVARALKQSLNTNVRVKSVKGKNKIEIEFADEDDLQRLFKVLVADETPAQKPDAVVEEQPAVTEQNTESVQKSESKE